jgi:tetratricopeptide (TPR) repeat protein
VGNLAMVAYFQGQCTESSRLSDDYYASAQRRHDAHNRAWALRSQVYCLLPRGEFALAFSRLTEIEQILTQNPNIVDEALQIDLYGLLALVHLRQAEPDLALVAANKALTLMAETMPTSYLSLPAYAAVAETYLSLWETHPHNPPPTFKRRSLRQACRALRSYARVFPIGKPQAYLWRGLFEQQSGRRFLAKRLWAKSLAAAERLEMTYPQGLAHYQIGRHLPCDHPDRVRHLRRAVDIFAQLGATYDLEQAKGCMTNP